MSKKPGELAGTFVDVGDVEDDEEDDEEGGATSRNLNA